jgi:hypothetical protein
MHREGHFEARVQLPSLPRRRRCAAALCRWDHGPARSQALHEHHTGAAVRTIITSRDDGAGVVQ